MRFKSKETRGYRVFAVTGTNTVSFGIDFSKVDTKGLLGFAVERFDVAEDERYFLYGFKTFEETLPYPDEDTKVSTFDHPVQSFIHDDFTAKPDRAYEYRFFPLTGKPKNLDRSAPPILIQVRTEPLFSKLTHDVFFNRGVASSQAYRREFRNLPPDKLEEPLRQRALDWLSRDLDEAILRFIAQARPGDMLLGCFYEFRYEPVALALKKALDAGVDVRIIIDAKKNGKLDKKTEKMRPHFPRADNLKMIRKVGLPAEAILQREALPGSIQHNKFMVLLKGKTAQPKEVWTGSTNLSEGGIHGQTNVGHWVRDDAVAAAFRDYWNILVEDPGSTGSADPEGRRKTAELRQAVEALSPTPAAGAVAAGVTPVFSPRPGPSALELYGELLDTSKDLSCITLAFGISDVFKQRMADNSARDRLAFFLLEKEDVPNPRSKKAFVALNAKNNVYKAWGSFLKDPLYHWARETSAGRLGLNQHVSFIHSKFLLQDPLGKDPIVVTGSANFSAASTNDNDENMLVIRGSQRVADIYFTEFNRLFFHYYFRSVQEATHRGKPPAAASSFSPFLAPDDSWIEGYRPGSLRAKRVGIFTGMQGFTP